MSDDNATTKRDRAIARLRAYFATLPKCSIEDYGKAESAEHALAQSRILELCTADSDQEALAQFLLEFTYWYDALRKRPTTWGDFKDAADRMELTVPLSDPVDIGTLQVGACFAVCQCAGCKVLRAVMSGMTVSDCDIPEAMLEKIKIALAGSANLDKKAKA